MNPVYSRSLVHFHLHYRQLLFHWFLIHLFFSLFSFLFLLIFFSFLSCPISYCLYYFLCFLCILCINPCYFSAFQQFHKILFSKIFFSFFRFLNSFSSSSLFIFLFLSRYFFNFFLFFKNSFFAFFPFFHLTYIFFISLFLFVQLLSHQSLYPIFLFHILLFLYIRALLINSFNFSHILFIVHFCSFFSSPFLHSILSINFSFASRS